MRALRIRFGITMAVMAFVAICAGQSSAAPIVTEITSGTSGDYTLNFSVTNDLGGINGIYFFGVMMDSGNVIVGSPPQFDPNLIDAWSNAPYGGSSLVYNLDWIDDNTPGILNGDTQAGFLVQSTDTTLPTSINWFAYGFGGTYTGNDNFGQSYNPGFEGVVSPQFVPEPSTLLLGLLGSLGGFAYFRRSQSRTAGHETR